MAIGFIILLFAGQQFNFNLTEAYKMAGLRYHSSIGMFILISVTCLLGKRFLLRNKRPDANLNFIKKLLANSVQLSLYTIAVLLPISGLLSAYYSETPTALFGLVDISQFKADAGLFKTWRNVHEWSTFIAIFLALSHAGAALYHHLVKKDEVLTSMLDVDLIAERTLNLKKKIGLKSM
jgi:cytochrome b561